MFVTQGIPSIFLTVAQSIYNFFQRISLSSNSIITIIVNRKLAINVHYVDYYS